MKWFLLIFVLLVGCSPPESGQPEEVKAWIESVRRVQKAHDGDLESMKELLACAQEKQSFSSGPAKHSWLDTSAEYYWLLRMQNEGEEIDINRLEKAKNSLGEYGDDYALEMLESGEAPYIYDPCAPEISYADLPEETEKERLVKEYYLAKEKAYSETDNPDIFYRVVQLNRELPTCYDLNHCARDNFLSNIFLFEAANGGHPQAIQDVLACLKKIENYPEKPRALLYWAEQGKGAGLPISEEDIKNYEKNLIDHQEELSKLDYLNASVVGPYDWMVTDPDYPC